MRHSRKIVSALAASALVLAACSSDDDSGGSTDSVEPATSDTDASGTEAQSDDSVVATDAPDGSDVPVETDPPEPEVQSIGVGRSSVPVADDYDESGTFTWAYTVPVTSFDPHRGVSGFDQNWLFPVYDRLVYSSPDGGLEPMLATDWRIVDDGLGVEMDIREGVVFQDGTPLDAAAVKANLDRARSDEQSVLLPVLASLADVEVLDEFTVKLVLTGGLGPMLATLADRAGMIISPAAFDSPDLATQPVGTGPYMVEENRLGDRVIYTQFPDYWDPEVQRTEKIEFRVMRDDQTRLNALQANEIDMALVRQNQVGIAEGAGMEILAGNTPTFYNLSFNAEIPPFDDADVRLALQHAMDRALIAEGLFDGLCTAQIQHWPSGSFAYDSAFGSGLDVWDYNPDKAVELLEEAGFPDGFEFTVIVPSITGFQSIAEVLQDQFSEVGVTMNIRVVEGAQVSEEFLVAKSAEASIGSYSPSPDPDGVMTRLLLPDALGNPGHLSSDEVVALATEAANLVDTDERAEVYHELTQALIDLVPHSTPVCMQVRTEAFQPGVSGLDIYASGARDYRGVAVGS